MNFYYPTAFRRWNDDELYAIERVLVSGNLTMGQEVKAFEVEFAAYHGRRHGIMVNSGSSANLIAVAAACAGGFMHRGDRIAVPAVAWSTTYAPLVQHGLELDVVDIDSSWNMDPSLLRMVRDRTGARHVLICPVLGNPMNMEEYPQAIIEDCCESLGAVTASGRKCGTFGLMSTFSFFHSHQISAVEGGMILTDSDKLADLCRMLRAHGWTRDTGRREGFDFEYDFRVMGYNVRPTEIYAAVAREQLKKLPEFVDMRRRNLECFWELVAQKNVAVFGPVHPAGSVPSPFGIAFDFDFRVDTDRARVVDALRQHGIDARPPTGGSFLKHCYGEPYRERCATPQADWLHDHALFIGNAPYVISDKIAVAVETLAEALS